MVHHRGIEISIRSVDAINKVVAPIDKTKLQSLIKAFNPLLKLKADQEFVWGIEQQLALDEIKKYLVNPPILVPPQHEKPLRLYLSTDDTVIGSALFFWNTSFKNLKRRSVVDSS